QVFDIYDKKYFGKAQKEIEASGATYSKEELVKRGYAPQLMELNFKATVGLSKYADQNFAAVKKRSELIEQGNRFYFNGNCEEAVKHFKEAAETVKEGGTLFRQVKLDNTEIKSKISECEKNLKSKAEEDKVKQKIDGLVTRAKEAESSGDYKQAKELYV